MLKGVLRLPRRPQLRAAPARSPPSRWHTRPHARSRGPVRAIRPARPRAARGIFPTSRRAGPCGGDRRLPGHAAASRAVPGDELPCPPESPVCLYSRSLWRQSSEKCPRSGCPHPLRGFIIVLSITLHPHPKSPQLMKHRIRFVMVGGFLGAGKTTTLGRLARVYMERGLNVGVVTND